MNIPEFFGFLRFLFGLAVGVALFLSGLLEHDEYKFKLGRVNLGVYYRSQLCYNLNPVNQ